MLSVIHAIMERRTVLKLAGGAILAGGSIAGGYQVVSNRGTCDSGARGHQWCYGVKGRLDAVSNGMVFVRERTEGATPGNDGFFEFGPSADGEIVALDAETGEIRWTYGEAVGMDSYTDLAVSDGVYFGYCTDQMGDCTDLTALELDGEERWVRDVNPGHSRPRVVDGVVYVAEYNGPVRALNAETGDTRWERNIDGGRSYLRHVDDDAVYIEADAETGDVFVSIGRGDGSVRWRYESPVDQVVIGSVVVDEVAYVVTFDQVAAVNQGDELWRRDFEKTEETTDKEIEGIASERLFLLAERDRTEDGRRVFQLDAIDLVTGERDWTTGPLEHPNLEYRPYVGLANETVYVGTDRLRALHAATGEERWNASLDDGSIQSVSVVEEPVAGDHAIFAHADGRLVSFAPDGEKTWEDSISEEIRSYLVDESVFVATDEGIYALDRQDNP